MPVSKWLNIVISEFCIFLHVNVTVCEMFAADVNRCSTLSPSSESIHSVKHQGYKIYLHLIKQTQEATIIDVHNCVVVVHNFTLALATL